MLEPLLNGLAALADDASYEVETVRQIEEERNDTSPDSIMMQTVQDVLLSSYFQGLAIKLITDDQMWENSINKYGMKLPKYKPATIRKKAKLGFPPDKLDRYTNYWTGTLRNHCIKVAVFLSEDRYDFKVFDYPNSEDSVPLAEMDGDMMDNFSAPNGFKPYSLFIPSDRIGLTEENIAFFESLVKEEVADRLDRWEAERLREAGIDPEMYGFAY